ncbi:protein root UVB sensitive [Trifolium repens]|nr:protein root UVB sensitive [Trifolium repens]
MIINFWGPGSVGKPIGCVGQRQVVSRSKEHLLSVASYYTKAKYLLVEKKGNINVIVHKDSSGVDVLKSFIHAIVLANNVHKGKSLHSDSQMWMDSQYEVFIQKLKSLGWKTEQKID